jgi:hypothetical protein
VLFLYKKIRGNNLSETEFSDSALAIIVIEKSVTIPTTLPASI